MRGSREISLVPSLHRASTDALIIMYVERRDNRFSDVGALRCVGSSLLCATAVSKRNGE